MSYVFASPEWVAAAASDLASIGSTINAASAAAAMPTSAVMAAGADDVSAVIAALFGAHAQAYQQLSAQAAMFHEQFVQLMSSGANLYAGAEAANATPMQQGAAPSNDVAMATAAAAQSMNTGAANRVGAALGAARSGASSFASRATALARPGGRQDSSATAAAARWAPWAVRPVSRRPPTSRPPRLLRRKLSRPASSGQPPDSAPRTASPPLNPPRAVAKGTRPRPRMRSTPRRAVRSRATAAAGFMVTARPSPVTPFAVETASSPPMDEASDCSDIARPVAVAL
ncbi:PE family protein [Mycobacterium camsae]|uniref:PE family protein n=1 Tax=Mycobacterium gordonae TaxID=1778 RepID=UPI00198228FF|nr:PE family protein [Mycobacterium gordonae]